MGTPHFRTEFVSIWGLLQFPVRLIFFWDFSHWQRDLSLRRREISRFLLLYYSYCRLVRQARGNRCHTLIEHQAHPRSCCRRAPPPPSSRTAAVVNGSHSSCAPTIVVGRRLLACQPCLRRISSPSAVLQCVLLTEQGPILFLIRVRGGNPMPLKFGTKSFPCGKMVVT